MVWESIIDQRSANRIELFAASLMPDHLHLLVSPREMDILKFVGAWKSFTTRKSWGLGNSNALWQPRYWDRTIRSDDDFGEVAAYILGNPVAAGLVDDERSWPHSWAWWWDD
jgi:putative transposase